MKKLFFLFLSLMATTCLLAEDFSVDGIYYNYLDGNNVEVTYSGDYADSYYEYSGAVTIPASVTYNGTTYSVTSIGFSAFYGCTSLTSITIPNSVTSIGDYAFSNCYGLTIITIPSSVTSIGEGPFSGTGIYNDESNWENSVLYIDNCLIGAKESISGSYTIKENTRLIADHAFSRCYSLTSVTIGNSVTNIGRRTFCYSLMSVIVESGNTVYDSRENCNAIIETASNTLIAGCQNTIIPNSVTSIGEYAFYACHPLTSITIPNSVMSIGDYAFQYCQSLTSITIPNSVTSIGRGAFDSCHPLTSITIPNSVTSIGSGAFNNCSGLTSITIPNSITSIGHSAFSGCSSLTSMVVESGNSTYDSRENCNAIIETASNTLIAGCQNTIIPNNVISIGVEAFCGCSFTSVTIPNSVTSIGDGAFNWCGSLTSVTIPNSVTSIGEQAFCGCSFTSVTIPNSVTSIGIHAFAECTSLDSVTCLAMTPPAMEENVFSGCDNPTLFVPCQALLDYQVHEQWGQLTTIECISSEEAETEEVIIESGTTTVTITWPTEDNADTYAIVIEKDDEIFCTLTFNADGQLLNIAFAPARNGNSHGAQSAAQTAKGLRFTVIGLEEATTYAYNIIAKDATDKTINSYLGEFTTKGGTTTDMDNIQSPATTCQKLLRNGQLIILRDGKEYTTMGAEM